MTSHSPIQHTDDAASVLLAAQRHVEKGEPEAALVAAEQARALAGGARNHQIAASAARLSALAAASKREFSRAEAWLDEAAEHALKAQSAEETARVLNARADLWFKVDGHTQRAESLWEEARRHAALTNDGAEISRASAGLALAYLSRGETVEALRAADSAVDTASLARDAYLLGRALVRRARVRQQRAELGAARQDFDRALEVYSRAELSRELGLACLAYGCFAGEHTSDVPEFQSLSLRLLARANELLRDSGSAHDLGLLREAFRRYGARTTDRQEARRRHGEGELSVEHERLRTLLDLTRSLSTVREAERLPSECVRRVAQLLGADRVSLSLMAEDGRLVVRATSHVDRDDAHVKSILERTAQSSSGPSLVGSPEHLPDIAVTQSLGMVCPLRVGAKVVGALYCDKALVGGTFDVAALELFAAFAAQAAPLLENARVSEALELATQARSATLEAVGEGVLWVRADGRVDFINRAAARVLGRASTAVPFDVAQVPDLAYAWAGALRGDGNDERTVHLAAGDFVVTARPVRDSAGVLRGLAIVLLEMKRAAAKAMNLLGSTARYTFGDLLGESQKLRRVLRLAESAAKSDSSVLITGESGTGKELLAQAIHNASAVADAPYVGLNCAAIPRELLESELFGHEPGAFTGAGKTVRPGKFELAGNGTLLLDEIGDMPLEMQAKLLRVLQERRVQRVGGSREIPISCRIIASTHRDLAEESERGAFRRDLFYRLRVIYLELPSLRDRPEDIPMLAAHYLKMFSVRLGRVLQGISPHVMDALVAHSWPGNIRELEHTIEAEVNMADPEQTLLTEIPVSVSRALRPQARETILGARKAGAPHHVDSSLLTEVAEDALRRALEVQRGRVKEVAEVLGVSRGTVYNMMKRLNIDPKSFRSART